MTMTVTDSPPGDRRIDDDQTHLRRESLADSGDGLTVDVLRALFRNLLLWRCVYLSDGVEIIPLPDGSEISIHDVEYLLLLSRYIPVRHRQAIYLCLVYNKSEEEAARAINIDGTNPVATYATIGLQEILTSYKLGLSPKRSKVYAREMVLRNRGAMATQSRPVDFGPGAFEVDYGYGEIEI